ncbi:MAG: glycosyltransferase [Actinomycetota bacterium]
MPKILFLVTEDWYFVSHRLDLARRTRDAGYEVVVATRVQAMGDLLEREGFRVIPISMLRRSRNLWHELQTIRQLIGIYQAEGPDIVHHVALKPILYGTLAAWFVGIGRVVNAAAGMGFVFTSSTWKARLLRPLITLGLKVLLSGRNRWLIVQNRDDGEMFRRLGIGKRGHVALVRGSGVDVEQFVPLPEPPGDVTVAVVARMLWDKGVHKVVEAVRKLRAEGEPIRLLLVGDPDLDNPAAVPRERLEEWAREDGIEWLGFKDDIREVWARAHIACLPSRREGLPRSLLEAAACGRPMIATDVPGCRELVHDGENGILVQPRDVPGLAEAIRRLARDPALRARMGARGRKMVVDTFSDDIVIAQHLDLYRRVLEGRPAVDRHPPRILFLSDNFPPEMNAAATRVYERACYWVRWDCEVTVLTCAPNFPEGKLFAGYENRWLQTETMNGIRVARVKTFIAANAGVMLRTLDFMSYMVSAVAAGLFQPKPDMVVATSPQFFAAVGGWLLARLRRVPFVFELSDLWPASIVAVGAMRPSLPLRMVEKVELFLYRQASVVVALTNSFKANLVSRGIDPAKIQVVKNGVDLDRYHPQPRDEALAAEWDLSGKFVAGYIGTHGMAHGLRNVLDAAQLLAGRDDIRFMLVGAGAERDGLIAEAKARGLTNVVFVPPQPKDKVPAFWSLCDVALVHLRDSPVFREVIPSKMFEAMGMGVPVLLVVPDGEARTILEDDQAGVWAPPENPQALADACRRLADDRAGLAEMAERSHAAAPRHTREAQAREMLAVLEAVRSGHA